MREKIKIFEVNPINYWNTNGYYLKSDGTVETSRDRELNIKKLAKRT